MKRIVCFLVCLTMLIGSLSIGALASAGGDDHYGWQTSENDFTGWTVTSESELSVDFSAVKNQNIWRGMFDSPLGSFTLTMTVTQTEGSCPYVKIFDSRLQLNTRDTSEEKVYVDGLGSNNGWLNAAEREVKLTITHTEGQNQVNVTLMGKNNDTPLTGTMSIAEGNQNLELGIYAGTASFSGISYQTGVVEPVQTPGDFGWDIDDKDFTGWEATDEANLRVDGTKAVKNRVWKEILVDSSFTVTMTVTPEKGSCAYIKVKNSTIELDARSSEDRSEVEVKGDGLSGGAAWLQAEGREVAVTLTRAEGDTNVSVTLQGKNGATRNDTLIISDTEKDNKNLELGVYGNSGIGSATFADITYSQGYTAPPEPAKTPGDFDWSTDGDFTGWTAEDGTTLAGTHNGSDDFRVWKEIIDDPNCFTVTVTVTPGENSRAYVKVLGGIIELNSKDGSGDKLYTKVGDKVLDWLNAEGQEMKVTLSRASGQEDISVELLGKGETAPTIEKLTVSDSDKENKNLEIGLYEGSASFKGIEATAGPDNPVTPPEPEKNPVEDAGWDTDDNNSDFTGWEITDGEVLTGTYQGPGKDTRVWKDVIGGKADSFTASVTVTPGEASRAYVKLLGGIVELSRKGANGEQVFVKLSGAEEGTWIDAPGFAVTVTLTRANGQENITAVVTNAGKTRAVTAAGGYLTIKEEDKTNTNLELGLYEGSATFEDIQGGDGPAKPDTPPTAESEPESPPSPPITPYTPPAPSNQSAGNTSGWSSDSDDLTGWVFNSETDFSVDRSAAVNNRVWKELDTDGDGFTVTLNVTPGTESSAYVKLMGGTVELDSRNGNGNQVYVKGLDKIGEQWLDAEGCEVAVELSYAIGQGKILVRLRGNNNETELVDTVTAPERDHINLELGSYAGTVSFSGIAQGQLDADSPARDLENGIKDGETADDGLIDTELWRLGGGWTVDEADGRLILTDKTGGDAVLKQTIDLTKEFAVSMNWVTESRLTGSGVWGEQTALKLRLPDSENYLFVRLKRYINDNGVNQVYLGVQLYDAGTDTWSADTVSVWGTKEGSGQLNDIQLRIVRLSGENGLRFQVLDGKTKLIDELLTAAKFKEDGMGDKFTQLLTQGTQAVLSVNVPDENTAPYYLTAPVWDKVEEPARPKTFADYGWDNDDGNFTGWTLYSGQRFKATYTPKGNNRIWKPLYPNRQDFTVSMDVKVSKDSSAYCKIMGAIFEIDSRHANGDQVYVKINGSELGWLDTEGSLVKVLVERSDGGDIHVTLDTNKTKRSFDMTPTEPDNENFEIGVYAGTVQFSGFGGLDATPITGDSGALAFWVTALLLSAGGMAVLIWKRERFGVRSGKRG